MTTTYKPVRRAQYPYVVEPYGDRWQVLFVRTDTPYRVAEFDDRQQAFRHIRALNESWWYALTESRRAIRRAQETAALQLASAAPSWLARLRKVLLRLLSRTRL